MISVVPYVILQIPLIDGREKEDGALAALIGMILSFLGLILYCAYQVQS